VELLGEHDIAARLVDGPDLDPAATSSIVQVTQGLLLHGLVLDDPGLVVLTGEDISGQKASTRDMRKMPTRRKRRIDPLELSPGDYVVHLDHGVGKFLGPEPT
jgi:transcription-repair coupling factor (superfamily II helicase)